MRQDKFSKAHLTLYACGVIPVVWLALLLAPYMGGGLAGLVRYGGAALDHPFHIIWCEDSLKTVLIFMLCYGLGIGVYLSTDRNYRRREEHGSAKWGDPKAINRKYSDKEPSANKILTQNVAIGLDGRKHRRNLNVLVVGGSGAGKTRFYAKPNIMNANTSLIVLDCKGEILRDTGGLLEASGYNIKVLDLINMEKSHCYNPFDYLRNDNDIQRMVTNLFKNTTPKGAQSQDPFWDQAAQMLLLALVFYLHYEAPEEEQNFPMVMEMIRAGEVREDDDAYRSPLDELFDRLEMQDPEHIALKYYRNYRSGSGKTLKSIQITLVSRLEKFNLESLAGMTQTDEMELWSLGEKKTAIFAVIPDNDSSFNFIVGMLYTQLFQQLYYQADVVHGGRLPVHVHFVMDEFANVALPDEFDKLLATMRSSLSSRPFLKNSGRALWETVMNFSIWAATSSPPTSMCPNCWARRPLTRTPMASPKGGAAATPPTGSSRAENCSCRMKCVCWITSTRFFLSAGSGPCGTSSMTSSSIPISNSPQTAGRNHTGTVRIPTASCLSALTRSY